MPGLPNDRQRIDQMPVSRTQKTRKLCLRSHPAWVRRSKTKIGGGRLLWQKRGGGHADNFRGCFTHH